MQKSFLLYSHVLVDGPQWTLFVVFTCLNLTVDDLRKMDILLLKNKSSTSSCENKRPIGLLSNKSTSIIIGSERCHQEVKADLKRTWITAGHHEINKEDSLEESIQSKDQNIEQESNHVTDSATDDVIKVEFIELETPETDLISIMFVP